MRHLLIGLALLVATSTAHAGSYTVTTTAEQDEALAQIATQMATTPKATSQQAVQFIVERNLMTRVQALQKDRERAAMCAKVTDAQAKQALGCKP